MRALQGRQRREFSSLDYRAKAAHDAGQVFDGISNHVGDREPLNQSGVLQFGLRNEDEEGWIELPKTREWVLEKLQPEPTNLVPRFCVGG